MRLSEVLGTRLRKLNLLGQNEKTVFVQTRKRLTLFYSIILTSFLAVFVTLTLFVFYMVITNDQEQALRLLSDREVSMAERALIGSGGAWREQEHRSLMGNQVFYYLTENDGHLIINQDKNDELHGHYVALIKGWVTDGIEVRRMAINISKNDPLYEKYKNIDMDVLVLARPIIHEGQRIAMLYMAVDNAFYSSIIKWIVVVFVSFALAFSVMGVLLSRWMARRTLKPIEIAYNSQKDFVSNASHELRTPLSVILSGVEVLGMEADKENQFMMKTLGTMKHEVKRMSGLITELLALARSDAEQDAAGLKKQLFDVRPIAEQMIESFSKIGSEKQIALKLVAPEKMVVYGDRDKLAQLMYILTDNALKYTQPGGHVEIALEKHSSNKLDEFILSVKDTGIGILPEEQLKIFERFYRTDKVRSRKEGGFGLGLSIAKTIASAHKGEITVESESGKGSVFCAKIPLEPDTTSI
ncbi:signal transduction histidine kinase [Planomicrobium soli]|uniref:histidine kinase n=1 Tax=Planomicrobium soli TaxID=1176648 RepID=A0A2P8H6K8_9BACL|nr:HAMP domain-containing sensor histidine kinase [Planomicrobium soli]PSL41831.1 signal transduction histidine kinase [Planomicrobium soli]